MLSVVRRGLLGGTFDPPHIAHLVAGEVAYRDLELDVVTFIPAGHPWQKAGDSVTSPKDRWEMTRLAVEGVSYFEADDREVRRSGWTYTFETLTEFPEDEELFLILGSDAADGITTWHRWEEVLERADLAVAPRPGTPREDIERAVPRPFTWLDMPTLDVSGTMLRERAGSGLSIRFMVRENVWQYINRQGLYG
ncbi:MAG TPA: nicotinate (nicotinamide) nucleotide adenylyltransferase [Actinobacteria bacterium]|nr:putative nicotinate-nucleotide adenylyltransferase [bacterium BMS3Bbin01]HDH26727.1 nicotinate (nicotinamide) nucleotide adenylyltransferase [Actinomycetota bacterium]HDK45393.1 nicotinate (nicotinamide) nucleotide adenylyltransferase [Actinomycetota bacterium]